MTDFNESYSEAAPLINNNPALQDYYASLESRIGYRLILGGTRHFGYYDSPNAFPLPFGCALRRMEAKLLEFLALPAGSQIMDAGCGVGHVALYMARHGMRVTAIDVVDRHIVKAKRNVQKAHLPVTVEKMDYHHLEAIADDSHEGVYTMETFVHATDPEAVLAGFHRILRPGGRLALFEYDHLLEQNEAPSDLTQSMRKINEYAAMPTNSRSDPGQYRIWLEAAGFTDVQVRDISANIRPMLLVFWLLAVVPYFFVRLLHLEKYFINTVAGYNAYRGQAYWRYVAVTASKPGGPIEERKTK
ncbi:methyltransferase type 11 [Grosmannia clavigera kw1407]|uniref:Methyltransferase type 11 n=1 Tax=Grosmannia clavigera (strain kw1407 / UAMH 11150) TaxID=655863 RepID=F0XRD1_GROCL|nr:methyltransferase type 11 [Grosmannia clavigera kw1407]EFW99813.1 methyltransferase type 11 [Grosmannia clavigera kw1407]